MNYKRIPRTSLKVGDEFKIMPNSPNAYVLLDTAIDYDKMLYMNVRTRLNYYMYDTGHAYIKSKVYPQRSRKI